MGLNGEQLLSQPVSTVILVSEKEDEILENFGKVTKNLLVYVNSS